MTALARLLSMAVLAVLSALMQTNGSSRGPARVQFDNAGGAAVTGVSEQRAADAIQIAPQSVYTGCNDIVVNAPTGTDWSEVVAHFSDPASVASVWRFDNTSKRYHGVYFADAAAPTDGPAASDVDPFPIFVCVVHDGRVG